MARIRLKELVLVLALFPGCVDAPPTAMESANTADPGDAATATDAGWINVDSWRPHPIHAIWEREPTPLLLEMWNRATRRWGRVLIPPFRDSIHVVSESDQCQVTFGVGTELEPLTIHIAVAEVARGAWGHPCELGATGAIALGYSWWEREDAVDERYYMETALAHEIGHVVGIGASRDWSDRLIAATSIVFDGTQGADPDTVEWMYRNDPELAKTLVRLTGGEWQGNMVPLSGHGWWHWHWCLPPGLDCLMRDENDPDICYGQIMGGDVMGGGGRITRLTLEALDTAAWDPALGVAEEYGWPEGGRLLSWRQALARCPRPLGES